MQEVAQKTSTRRSGQRELHAGSEYLGAAPEVAGEGFAYGDQEEVVAEVDMSSVDAEAFMNQQLTIIVQSTGAEHETPMVPVAVNGQTMYLPREEPILVKRKYVEVLARAKRTDFDQVLDFRMGEQMNRLQSRNSLKYPFSVISDPAGAKGAAWVRDVLAQRR